MIITRKHKLTLVFGDTGYIVANGRAGWFCVAGWLKEESSTDKLIRQIYGSKEWWA